MFYGQPTLANVATGASGTLIINATDSYNFVVTTLKYLLNRVPVRTALAFDNPFYYSTGTNHSLELNKYFSDPDGDILIYTVIFTNGVDMPSWARLH